MELGSELWTESQKESRTDLQTGSRKEIGTESRTDSGFEIDSKKGVWPQKGIETDSGSQKMSKKE